MDLAISLALAFGRAFFVAQNDTRAVASIDKLVEAKRSGANVDAHMQRVADSLLAGEPMDWDALDAEIDAEVAAFLA